MIEVLKLAGLAAVAGFTLAASAVIGAKVATEVVELYDAKVHPNKASDKAQELVNAFTATMGS